MDRFVAVVIGGGLAWWCGHSHRTQQAAEKCVERLKRRFYGRNIFWASTAP